MTGWLGIDVGGTKVALRLEGETTTETTFRWEHDATPAEDLKALQQHVRELGQGFAGVGVAMPATLDKDGRVTTWPGRPSWTGFDLGRALEDLFDVKVNCADDGDLAALAEAKHAGSHNVVYIGVGTGIGGGIVLNGQLLPSAEIGHTVIDRNGPLCRCGRRGCVQAFASGPATLARADRTFDELKEAWLAGDDWAVSTIAETSAAIAAAVTTVAELLHPELAIIGGGFADGMPGLATAVAEQTKALARPGHPAIPVQAAALGGLSSLHGAVLLARIP